MDSEKWNRQFSQTDSWGQNVQKSSLSKHFYCSYTTCVQTILNECFWSYSEDHLYSLSICFLQSFCAFVDWRTHGCSCREQCLLRSWKVKQRSQNLATFFTYNDVLSSPLISPLLSRSTLIYSKVCQFPMAYNPSVFQFSSNSCVR